MTAFLKREVARRVFAKELMNSTYTLKDESEKSPVYVLTPLGLKCNRVFIIGVLTEKEERGEDGSIYRIRVVDQTGSFVGYVGRYQPEAYEALEDIDTLTLVALTAKVRVFEGETGKFVTLRPETISIADPESRDYWVMETAIQTLERIKEMEKGEKETARLAMEVYNTNLEEYKNAVREAIARVMEDYGEIGVEEEEEEEIEEEEFEVEEEEISFEEEEIDLTELLED
ncbi:RPA family protein [Archaeoglobus fulgidus]|uniref:Uncharacterized protein n=2 Tax=Archaeoglobus fulgidus TaxID=2234 RepID=A0A075WEX5_ARCFL|nr:RPA family protein [Archaeoglobus fulgidus]AIG97654.1 hypothetical protein AFULGI_00008590 [Archaeoglobus fulgidus DSM 8774]KUJ93872.1 MAG: hypothetical protein XD40_0906 [Archaeoglobus fulgidus]KUK07235.1 MAG: hypothetical protein XD48_0498 [Archaeoglobus fulgidus]